MVSRAARDQESVAVAKQRILSHENDFSGQTWLGQRQSSEGDNGSLLDSRDFDGRLEVVESGIGPRSPDALADSFRDTRGVGSQQWGGGTVTALRQQVQQVYEENPPEENPPRITKDQTVAGRKSKSSSSDQPYGPPAGTPWRMPESSQALLKTPSRASLGSLSTWQWGRL